MTITQIERATTQDASPNINRPPTTQVMTASAPSRDVEDAEEAASVAALLSAIALLIVGIVVTATTTLTAPPLQAFAITATVASTPFVVASAVYARHRLVRMAADRWR
jgi:hypothetical protein